jgi:hypothetical protein
VSAVCLVSFSPLVLLSTFSLTADFAELQALLGLFCDINSPHKSIELAPHLFVVCFFDVFFPFLIHRVTLSLSFLVLLLATDVMSELLAQWAVTARCIHAHTLCRNVYRYCASSTAHSQVSGNNTGKTLNYFPRIFSHFFIWLILFFFSPLLLLPIRDKLLWSQHPPIAATIIANKISMTIET